LLNKINKIQYIHSYAIHLETIKTDFNAALILYPGIDRSK